MSGHAGCFTGAVLAGAVYLAGSLSFSAMAQGTPPNFAPNSSIGWYAYNRIFMPPASGAGPLQQDPARPIRSLVLSKLENIIRKPEAISAYHR